MTDANLGNSFCDFCTTCLRFIDILDLFSEPEVKPRNKPDVNNSQSSKLQELRDGLSLYTVDFSYINEDDDIKITYGAKKNNKETTEYLIGFIANEYKDDDQVRKQLEDLPKIGDEEQDKKLLKIAHKLALHKDNQFHSDEISQNPKEELKQEIKTLYDNRYKQDSYEQFVRECEDITTNIVSVISAPFELCLGARKLSDETSDTKQSR